MSDDDRKIIIGGVSEYRQNESGGYQRVPVSPLNRWLTYATLIPVAVILIILGIFFFATFLALLAVAVLVVGVRFWWLRRGYESAIQQPAKADRQSDAGQTVAIEDAQIIEETEARQTEQKKH